MNLPELIGDSLSGPSFLRSLTFAEADGPQFLDLRQETDFTAAQLYPSTFGRESHVTLCKAEPTQAPSPKKLTLETIRDYISQAAAQAAGRKKTYFSDDSYIVGPISGNTWNGISSQGSLKKMNNRFIGYIAESTGLPETTEALVKLKTENTTLGELAQALFVSNENQSRAEATAEAA